MKESGCTKSTKGNLIDEAVKDYEGTYPGYLDAVKRQREGIGDAAVVKNEILLYKILLLKAAQEIQDNS